MVSPWGGEVVDGLHGGHTGLVYRERPKSFADLVAGVDRWAQRTFLVHDRRRVSFGEFFAAVHAARDRLAEAGIKPGDRVLLLAYNSPEWVLALFEIWAAGGVPVWKSTAL